MILIYWTLLSDDIGIFGFLLFICIFILITDFMDIMAITERNAYLGSFLFNGNTYEIVEYDEKTKTLKGLKYPPETKDYISINVSRVDNLIFESLEERAERLQTILSNISVPFEDKEQQKSASVYVEAIADELNHVLNRINEEKDH